MKVHLIDQPVIDEATKWMKEHSWQMSLAGVAFMGVMLFFGRKKALEVNIFLVNNPK